MTGIFCGKLFRCPVREPTEARNDRRYPHKYGVVCAIHRQAARQHDRVPKHASAFAQAHTVKLRITQANEKRVAIGLRGTASGAVSPEKLVPKMKDPSGGTTGRVKLYGRLGWMGARAEYSRWGGITAPTLISRSTRAERSKRQAIFLTFCLERLPQKSRRNRLFRGVCGRFVCRHRRLGVIQCPAHGSVIGRRVERRCFFARRLA